MLEQEATVDTFINYTFLNFKWYNRRIPELSAYLWFSLHWIRLVGLLRSSSKLKIFCKLRLQHGCPILVHAFPIHAAHA